MTVVINGTTGIDTGTGSLIAANASTPTYLDLFEDTDNGSNYVRLIAPTSVASNRTITLPDGTGTVVVNNVNSSVVSGTAVTLTNQTAPDLSTTIPSWVKRITVMFNGVSQSSATPFGYLQVGSGSYSTSGYVNTATLITTAVVPTTTAQTQGFVIFWSGQATDTVSGHLVLTLISGNSWVASGNIAVSGTVRIIVTAGNITLGGALDRIRLTTQDGTTQFDAGSVNLFYE